MSKLHVRIKELRTKNNIMSKTMAEFLNICRRWEGK